VSNPQSRIAFQGELGAYSHLACTNARPQLEPYPCASFDDAFAAVKNGDAALGMIPIENTLGGRVADIHHLLPESDLHIVDEYYQAVQHCLLGVPGATFKDLVRVESHEQALAQCRHYLRRHQLRPIASADTAGAAREVAERGDRQVAGLASRLAGEIYGLEVLEENVEDREGNTTRFVVMSRSASVPDVASGPCMTSIVFQLRSVPAALYKALGGFATNGVNITKLESYIMDSSFTSAQFYVEFEGHPETASVANALAELDFFTDWRRVLGTFPAHAFRRTNLAKTR
jgi:prephenate dehydratase